MDAKQTVCMNPGEGETSYARNSILQSAEQTRLKPLIEEVISELCSTISPLPSSIVVADLGCSCGPNAITLVSTTVNAIHHQHLQIQKPPPELSLHLNDLPSNDFNSVVKHLASFQDRLNSDNGEEEFFPLVWINIVPGSFHGRLFISRSVHLFLSTTSLHWLSQVPEELVKNGIQMYHDEENQRKKMRPIVLDTYASQFREDFMSFLGNRAQEMVQGGRMVLSLPATHSPNLADGSTQPWELVAHILHDMASRGVLDKQKLKTFYIPMYTPYVKEVKDIIEEQGSFSICKLQVHDSLSGVKKALINPRTLAYAFRAGFEPIIVEHFGSSGEIMDEFFRTMEQHISEANLHDKSAVFIAVSLSKKS